MLRRAALLLVLSVPAAAANTAPDFAALTDAAARIHADLASGRVAARSAAHAVAAAVPAAPARRRLAALRCLSVDGRGGDFALSLDLDTRAVLVSEKDARPLLDSKLGDKLIDSRCGKTALPIDKSANWEITAPHTWGQYVLQAPAAVIEAGRSASFEANLHSCDYDGDWSSSGDRRLKCELLVP